MSDDNKGTTTGKTRAEREAEQEAYVKEANEALASAREKGAHWWLYSVSLRTFELVIGDPIGNENIVLSLSGCNNIMGPVQWSNQQLIVTWQNRRSEGRWDFALSDDRVDFKAEAGAFMWRRNYDMVRYNSLYLRGSGL